MNAAASSPLIDHKIVPARAKQQSSQKKNRRKGKNRESERKVIHASIFLAPKDVSSKDQLSRKELQTQAQGYAAKISVGSAPTATEISKTIFSVFESLRSLVLNDWKALKGRGGKYATSIVNARSQISHLETSRDNNQCSISQLSMDKIWFQLDLDHTKLCAIHREMERVRLRITSQCTTMQEFLSSAVVNQIGDNFALTDALRVCQEPRHTSALSLNTSVALAQEVEKMVVQSLFLKHIICTQILDHELDHKHLVTLVASWEMEPYMDFDRLDEIFDMVNQDSKP